MYIWRKRATADWIRNRINGLVERFGPGLAIVDEADKARSLVQIATTKRRVAELVREFGGTMEKLPADWLAQFAQRSRAQPLRIGSRLIVADRGKVPRAKTIVIPAEAAFGTGGHATTAMCLRILERVTRNWAPGWIMLDAGTGSGILAIAGSRFRAGRIIGIDNDPVARATAERNARANNARNIQWATGDVLKQKLSGKFDVITANLFSEILIAVLPKWSRHLDGNGAVILSGVLRNQEKALLRALRRNNFAVAEVRRRGKWIALRAIRAEEKG